jgi:hypothetical protein
MKRLILTTLFILAIIKINYAQDAMSKAQANFIYNFTKFFDWPQTEKTGDFIIGVLGSKSLFTDLQNVTAGKKNVTQNIVIKYFKNDNEISKCQVIYVDALKSNSLKDIHNKTGVHCLIISNSNSSIEKGAVIEFIHEGDRLKYGFSQENALKHSLKFHSKVSEMASKKY